MSSLGETRKEFHHYRVFLELRQSYKGANRQSSPGIAINPIQPANTFKIHHPRRAGYVVLHRSQQILAPGDRSRRIVDIRKRRLSSQRLHSFGDTGWINPLKRLHVVFLSFTRPSKTLSVVIGSSRTRSPQAL